MAERSEVQALADATAELRMAVWRLRRDLEGRDLIDRPRPRLRVIEGGRGEKQAR